MDAVTGARHDCYCPRIVLHVFLCHVGLIYLPQRNIDEYHDERACQIYHPT
jgi:hypothetical protein